MEMTKLTYDNLLCKKFIGRDNYLKVLDEPDPNPVLMYYGIGGMGKSAISQEIIRNIRTNPNNIILKIDFSIPEHREKSHALSFLKYQLSSKYKIKLLRFELAYLNYWYKTNPYIPILREEIPYLEDADLTNDLLQNLFTFDEGTIKEIMNHLSDIAEDVPLIKIIPKLLKVISKINQVKNDTSVKKKNKELSELITKDATQILSLLPHYFAEDLSDYLLKNTEKKCFIFIDTYEELWKGSRDRGAFKFKDQWIKEMIKEVPFVQWIISGRENLTWKHEDEYWKNHISDEQVFGFDELEGIDYLFESGINEEDIQKQIFSNSNVPDNLRLSAIKYHDIKLYHQRTPTIHDFGEIPTDLLNRFEQHLNKQEINTMYILSIPRYWGREIFNYLTNEFNTGLNLFDFNDFVSLSFITSRITEEMEDWRVETNLRKAVLEYLAKNEPEILKMAQGKLVDFYKQKLNQVHYRFIPSVPNRKLIYEYLYVATCFFNVNDALLEWFFDELRDLLKESSDRELSVSVYEEVLEAVYNNNNSLRETRYLVVAKADLAALYKKTGNFELAERLLRGALEDVTTNIDKIILNLNLSSVLKTRHTSFSQIEEAKDLLLWNLNELETIDPKNFGGDIKLYLENKEELAILYFENYSDYESKQKAIESFNEIYEIKKNHYGETEETIKTLQNILDAKTHLISIENRGMLGLMEDLSLKEDFKTIILKYKKLFGLFDERVANSLYSLGAFYRTLSSDIGGLRRLSKKAYFLFKKAEEIFHSIDNPENTPDLARVNYELGLWFSSTGEHKMAIEYFNHSINMFEEYYGPYNDEIAAVIGQKGVASLHLKRYKDARISFEQAIDIIHTLYHENHPLTANPKLNLGIVYAERGAYRKAFKFFKEILSHSHESDPIYLKTLYKYKNYYWKSNKYQMDDKYEEIFAEIKRIERKLFSQEK
jgi:hypothetical protein